MEKQYFQPNRSNKNNYMLDSTAYNYIARKSEVLDIMKKSLLYGFRYYFTTVQDRELSGEGAKTYDSQCIPVRMKPMDPALLESFDLIDKELGIKVVSEVANAMKDHTRVDGTNRFISPESIEGKIYKEISSKNKKNNSTPFEYSHDAMIAEAAVHHGCILVTNDGELRETINKSISDGAITIEELIGIIGKISNVKEQGEDDTP